MSEGQNHKLDLVCIGRTCVDLYADCNGFAIGRSIYGCPVRRWLADEIDDEDLMSSVAERYGRMNSLWEKRTESRIREGATG